VRDYSAKNYAQRQAVEGLAILKSAAPADVTVVTMVVQGNITRPSRLSCPAQARSLESGDRSASQSNH